MTALVWDKTGEKTFQVGVDRGVLFLHDGTAVPWNGLTSVEESPSNDLKSYYLDGVKYLDALSPGDYVGKLKAYTYPKEFDLVNGIVRVAPGLSHHDQPPQSFNLTYRTMVGNDLEGSDYGYKIHILYNVVANPDSSSFNSLQESSLQPVEFGWSLTGTPVDMGRFRPTVHVSIDSRETPDYILRALEEQLYGNNVVDSSLPTILEVAQMFGYLGSLVIFEYGDGTWVAIDESDTYITMLDPTTFQIDNANAIYLDVRTYQISSTNAT